MKIAELVLIIVAGVMAVSVVVGVVYLVSALIQIKKASIELESVMRKLSTELDIINKVSGKVVSITEKLAFPVVSAFSFLFHIVSNINKRKKRTQGGGEMSDNKSTLVAFVLGGLIGAAFGILYAPKSGKETRRNIKKFSTEVSDTINDLSKSLTETGCKVYEEGKERVLSGIDKTSEVFETSKKAFKEYAKKD